MGVSGSGRLRDFGVADCTDDYRRLDVRRWQREGFLTPGRAFGWKWTRNGEKVGSINVRTELCRVILSYHYRSGDGGWMVEEYPVSLDWTACAYGGRRTWFLCPLPDCGRRVAILYGGRTFACRHCHHLSYPSQRESADDRAAGRANKIRKRLGWEPGFLNGEGGKPIGMRWRTFERLRAEHGALVLKSWAELAKRLERLRRRLG